MSRPLLIVLFLAGCGASSTNDAPSETPPSETSTAAAPADSNEGDSTSQEERTLLTVGTSAPDFSAQDQAGDTKTLAEHRGHPVVLYFYPRDATPGCTQEACAFRDAWDRLQATGAVVYGVSTDDVAAHRSFADAHELPFSLLADPDEAILGSYGVPSRSGYASRVTFLIDGAGVVRHVYPSVDPGVHADEVIQAIEALDAP